MTMRLELSNLLNKNSEKMIINDIQLMAEWNEKKNNAIGLFPYELTLGSGKKVWWICQQGHEWQACIRNRSAHKTGCPYCAGQRVWIGYNDLGTTNPELINEWDFDKNDILPSQVRGTSSKVVWWKCSLGHSYDMRIYCRAGSSKAGCPYCAIPAKRVLSGFNDLATISPYTLNEWDYEKNDISPDEVLPGSTQKVWWKCSKNHSFQQAINYKTSSKKESTCPYCSNKKVKKGYNDLATLSPELALEWHPTKNGHLLPTDVTLGSHKNVWWKCINGHEWQTKIETRKQGCGCPICSKHR